MSNLSGKVALVTGGSRGIGAAIARRLADDGAHVAITFANQAGSAESVLAHIRGRGRQGAALRADSADALTPRSTVTEVVRTFGRLDILVNNAAYMDPNAASLRDAPLESVDRTILVNIRGTFLYAQAASRHLEKGGRVINIASCLGSRVPCAGLTLYAMTKAAMYGLTKGLARDLAFQGVTVNQISPGPIDTDMNPANGANSGFQQAMTIVGRYGEPSEVAAAVSFLTSQEANFITGADIAVDGGTNV
jgi:3-oxoacyl-[acyl-carrier protein] reductase